MKKEFLKIAGVENESDFYKLFPTEEAFFGMFPEAKKLVKAAVGFSVTSQTTKPMYIGSSSTYVKKPYVDPVYAAGLNMKKEETVEEAYARRKAELDAARRKQEEQKKINAKKREQKIISERKARVESANTNPLNTGFGVLNPDNWTRENIARTAIAERFRLFPNSTGGAGEVFDEYVNPFYMVGSMADALASAPLAARETNSNLPYLTSLAGPLVMGRMLGSGSINPLSKNFWTNTVSNKQFVNTGLMGIPSLVETGANLGVKNIVVPAARKIQGLPAFPKTNVLSSAQLKEMRAVQDLIRSKSLGKSRDELLEIALKQNLSDDAFVKVFGFDKKQANDIIAGRATPTYQSQGSTSSVDPDAFDWAASTGNQLAPPPQEIDLFDVTQPIEDFVRNQTGASTVGQQLPRQSFREKILNDATLDNMRNRFSNVKSKVKSVVNRNKKSPSENEYTDYIFNQRENFRTRASAGEPTPQNVLDAFDQMMATPEGREFAKRHFTGYDYAEFIPPERANQWVGMYGHRITGNTNYRYPQLNAQLNLGQKATREMDILGLKTKDVKNKYQKFAEDLKEQLKKSTEKIAFGEQTYRGPVQENIGLSSLGSQGLKGFYDQVANVENKGFSSGTVFTGSRNTSYNSWLPQTKKVFGYKEGTPVFLGYRPMNSMGFLSGIGYTDEQILNYINAELSDLIRKNKIPSNIQRPYFDKKTGYIQVPHYGVRQKKYGGLVRAEDGIEYTGPSIVDYLATKGYKGTKEFRKGLAQQYGVENYDFSAAKNLELLDKLRQNQEILSKQERSFEPVSVETIEQLHQKNKAGLDRHSSLPGKKEAKNNFNVDRYNALLDIATMPLDKGMAKMPQFGFRSASQYAAMNKKPTTPSDPTTGEYVSDPGGYYTTTQEGEEALVLPEVVVTSPVSKKQIQEGKAKKQEQSLGLMDYLNIGAAILPQFLPGSPSNIMTQTLANKATNLFQQGKNYLQRQYALRTGEGDDLSKTKSEIQIPKVTQPISVANKVTPLTIDGMPYAEGNKIEMSDKSSRYYTKPIWIDLNSPSLKLGARNRGSRQGNIATEGFVITPFAKEYGTGYDDDGGINTIRKYNDNEIINDKLYGGIDKNGTFYLDYGKNLKGKNLEMADFREFEVTGIAKNKSGKYIYGDATDNKKVAKTAKAFDAQGNPTIDLNLLIPKKSIKTGHESFGQIGGGRYILATPDLSKKVLVAGSLKNIDQYIEDFKKSTGSKVIKMIPLDNGTFARGLSTKDGIITDEDQANYDNFNNKGGAAFYLKQKRHGGSILPKAFDGITFPSSISYDPKPLGLGPDPSSIKGGFSQFSLSEGMSQPSFNAPMDMGIPDCGEGATWDPINKKCVPREGYIEMPDAITGKSKFIKKEFSFSPQTEPIKQLWGQPTTETTTAGPKYLFGKFGEWMDKKGAEPIMQTAKALNMAFAFGNQLASQKEYRDFQRNLEKNLRNKIFTQPVMPSLSGFRGDYVTNTGAFRPNEYTVNKGMYTPNIPGAVVGTQQFAQFGGGIMSEALTLPEAEFSPMVAPEVPVRPSSEEVVSTEKSTYKHSGANPIAEKTWDEISKQYSGVKFLGVWGDKSHQKRKSDHNTGNALDIGILNIEQGDQIANQLINEANDKRIKYLIFNRKIWSPEDGWKTYTPTKANGNNPHTSHVHVSFYPYEGKKTDRKSGESIAVSHNNPGNIHFGEFTSQWGAEKGAYDNKGHVAIFNSLDEGWDAHTKLLLGPGYNGLTVEQARNKWVTGNPNKSTDSSKFILKELGIDPNVRIKDLDQAQQIKLASLFVKYEDNKMYKKMKDLKYFEIGGQVNYNEGEEYDLTEDEIRQIIENGGDIEYI